MYYETFFSGCDGLEKSLSQHIIHREGHEPPKFAAKKPTRRRKKVHKRQATNQNVKLKCQGWSHHTACAKLTFAAATGEDGRSATG